MSEIADEIQEISENADKCVNYPIGDKLAAFMRHQEANGDPNFVLSGVLIFAAAKVFGRKVDYLEQEILGIAKNFEQISAEEEKKAKEVKKSRTKKFTIKDAINIDKVTFEEKEINVVTKNDINKTLATPSRITRLQKMKEFFAKNKSKTGKLPIPKSLLMNDSVVSNFGGTLIHDYDDYKDIVGSRKDFRSFSHFINHTTGELQTEINFNTKITQQRDDFIISEAHPQIVNEQYKQSYQITQESPQVFEDKEAKEINDIATLPTPPPTPPFDISGKVSPDSNINLDEGIGMDEDPSNLLLSPIDLQIQLPEIFRETIESFPAPEEEEIITFETSINFSLNSIRENVTEKVVDFELPKEIRTEVSEARMKNIFMIPLKRLKHKCNFDLPDKEFKEFKKRKLDQWKSTAVPEVINPRTFKFVPPSEPIRNDEVPFHGFTKEEQNESMRIFNYKTTERLSKSLNDERCIRNDSGYDSLTSIDASREDITLNSSDEDRRGSFGIESSLDESKNCETTQENSTTDNRDTFKDHEDTDNDFTEHLNDYSKTLQEQSSQENNISGSDSCYQSLNSGVSGESSKLFGASFAEEFKIGNSTEIDIVQDNNEEQQSLESEERIKQMQQSAMNVAKWKEFLKPILAESEKRSKIDMHEYGLNVINKIGTINETKRFDEIIETGKTPAYFLTMLQLINNRNIEVNFANKTISAPTELHDISLTLKSKVVHKEKFDEMGEQFNQAEENKKNLKRKQVPAAQTSTPAKRPSLLPPLKNFTPNNSAVDDENNSQMCRMLSQASSGYFSQNSTFSDF